MLIRIFRPLAAAIIFAVLAGSAAAQNEQSPIVEKDIEYKDWSYKNVLTDESVNLRSFAKGKKLVLVVYYAPWCPNWRHDAPILERFYNKYKDKGLGIIAVGEYDPQSAMKTNLSNLKVSFPAVVESEARSDKQKTLHYTYRKSTGDNRNWGSPWYIFLDPAKLEKKGDLLTRKAFVINGEIIEAEGDAFIRRQLRLPAERRETKAAMSQIEVCDPATSVLSAKTP